MTRLKSIAARYEIVEEWLMKEQGTFVHSDLVIEV